VTGFLIRFFSGSGSIPVFGVDRFNDWFGSCNIDTDKVKALIGRKDVPPGPCSSRSGSWYSMSRTCGPRDIISSLSLKVGDNRVL
jgi:hypothetical protein